MKKGFRQGALALIAWMLVGCATSPFSPQQMQIPAGDTRQKQIREIARSMDPEAAESSDQAEAEAARAAAD